MNRSVFIRYSLIFSLLFSTWACQYPSNFEGDEFLSKKGQGLIGGTPDLRYPAVAALTVFQRPFCTATLIRPDVVLTAAHCIDAAKRYQGKYKVQFRVDFPQGKGFRSEFHEILSMSNHPNYQQERFNGFVADIGLIFLKKPVSNVTPIPFNRSPLGQSWVKKKLLFLGYGLLQTKPKIVAPSQKYGASLTIYKMYQDRVELYDYKKSLCSGDSGGPSLAKINGKLYVLSVNSYVETTRQGNILFCDGKGVAFRTDIFANWLDEMIVKHAVQCLGSLGCGSCFSCSATKKCVYKSPAPKHPMHCQPCKDDRNCKGKGFRCVSLKGRYRCLPPCNGACCPKGTYCRTFSMLHETVVKSCVPSAWKCPDFRCSNTLECGKDEVCLKGVCTLKVKLKRQKIYCERCEKDSDCRIHLVCAHTASGQFCLSQCFGKNVCLGNLWKCKKTLKGRDACYPPNNTCHCSDDKRCSGGAACRGGKCEKQGWKKENEACSSSKECLAPFVCLVGAYNKKTCLKECSSTRPVYPKGAAGSSCTSYGVCNEGLVCDLVTKQVNMCRRPCYGSGFCPSGGVCTVGKKGSVGRCLCHKDTDCRSGFLCNKTALLSPGACTKKTRAHLCKKNELCSQYSNHKYYCLPNQKCQSQTDCPSNMLCHIGFCSFDRTKCFDDDSCPKGEVCRKDIHECSKPGTSCRKDSDCSSSYTCDLIHGCTRRMCSKNEDCPKGKVCKRAQCVNPKTIHCAWDRQCPRMQWCLKGICKEQKQGGCRSSLDCSKSETCIFNTCQSKSSGCKIVQDCPIGHRCVNKSCVRDPYGACRVGNCPWGYRCRSYGSRSLCDRDWSVCAAELPCKGGLVCQFGACIHSSEVVEFSNEPSTNTEPFERLKFDASAVKESKEKTDKKRWAVPNAFRKNLPRLAVSRGCACAVDADPVPTDSLLWLGGISLLILLRKPRKP